MPLVSNVTAAPVTDPDAIRDGLVRQVTGTVRWRESVAFMAAEGVESFYEVGSGKVLTGLGKRIAAGRRPARPSARRTTSRPSKPLFKVKDKAMFDLTGRKALVTGATGGIGGAIARALHAQGAIVTLSGTRRSALDELAGALGERVHVVEANLGDKDSVEALVPAAESAMEGLDILVNNAGVTRDNLFMRMKDEEWDTVMAVNLTAAFRLSRAADEGHDAPALWPHRQYRFGGGRDRQSRTGELRRLKSGSRRHDEGARGRGREPQHHGQLRALRASSRRP